MLSLSVVSCWGAITIDATASHDSTTASAQITTPSFSTNNSNELLLAFVATDSQISPMAVTSVTGAGLTWELVARGNTSSGTSEIWRTFAYTPLTNVSVTANLAQSVVGSIQVLSFVGIDSSGVNGSGAIGASSVTSGVGAPSASLVTTRANSWVFGVGNDFDRATARTPGPGQIIVHQDFSPTNDTYWVQEQSSQTPASGTTVKINDTAPTGDHFNLAICEILAPSGTDIPNITAVSPTSGIAGASVTITGTKFGATQGRGGVTFNGTSATISSWSATAIGAIVPYGATSGKVVVTADDGLSSNGVSFSASPNPNAIAIDASAAADLQAPATQIVSPVFSTKAGGELLLALIASDSTAPGTKVNTVSGGGLTWVLVERTNTQSGDTEIWRAFASAPLTNASVTATLSQKVAASMQVLSFSGVDTTGTNGSGAIGAIGSGNANPGAPTASLTTTRANSWVFGVGNDFDNSIARRVGPGQAIIHQFFATVNDTYWMQRQNNINPVSGTKVTINDTLPVKDRYNLSIVEILPPNAGVAAPVITSLAPTSGAVGTSVTITGSNFGTIQGSSTVTFGGITASPTSWSNTSIIVPVPSGVPLGAVPVVVTVTGAGASNSATFTVVAALAIAVAASPAPNANNWNNTNVTLTYTCSGGVLPVQCPAPRTITTEGANQVIVATALDANGNQASVSKTLNIDKTIPTITASVVPAPAGNAVVTAPATITFLCTDSLSGVAVCPAPIQVTNAGATQVFSGTATDRAGNVATASVTLNVQLAALQVSAVSAPPANNAAWNNTNVTISYTCTGGVPPVQCPAAQIVSTEGANQAFSATATDGAGQTASASVTLNIDKTPPVISIGSPVNNSTVSSASLQVTGSVTDALSGVASVSCNSVAAQLQAGAFTCSTTLVAGANTITVSATDVAGNTSSQSLIVTFAAPAITDFNPKSGPTGTLITLSGSNLTVGGNPLVLLSQQGGGSIAAPITNSSATSISFVIPAGAATGTITVATGQQSAVSAAVLSVVASSSFTLTVGPSTASVLQGKSTAYVVTLNSSDGFTQLATLSVSGLPSGITSSFSPAQIAAGQISILSVTAPLTQPLGNTALTVSASAVVEGISNTQSASATISVQPITTSLFGRTIESDTIESPLGGIIITLLGVDDAGNPTGCTGRTTSDDAGNFSFTNLPPACVGRQLISYNGDFASDGEKYASVNLAYTLIAGQATGPELAHLPRIDNGETKMVQQNAPTDQIYTFSTMPGVSVTIYAGTVFTLPDGTKPDPFPFTGVQVPVDRLPDTPIDGPGTLRAYIVAFQPADTTTNQPVSVTFPNSISTPPGVNMELDTLDPVVGELVKYGTGTVSGDGVSVVPDLDPAFPGHRFGISHFDWHGPMAPGPNGNNPSPDPNAPNGGDPVDAASGLLVLNHTDTLINGANGQIAIVRTYRTLAGTPGPFGVGTNHNYGYLLDASNFIRGTGSFVTLVMPDGNQFQFVHQPDGSFINTTVPSLLGAVITNPGFSTYRLRWKNGSTYVFQTSLQGALLAYLSSISDTNGNQTSFFRGNDARPVQITQITDPARRTVSLTYDSFDRVTSIADPIGRVVSYTYNSQGTLATFTDARGGLTKYDYDSANRLTKITNPLGIVILQNIYDQNGKVSQQTDAKGGITKFSYTLLNPNLSTTAGTGGGGTISIGAGANINTSPVVLTTITDPSGNRITYHFNPQGYLLDTTDALGQKTIYSLDPQSNQVLNVTDPLNRVTTFTYDPFGDTTSVTRLTGTAQEITNSFTYDPIFNQVTSITGPLNSSTRFSYDPSGNLASITDPLNHQTLFAHNSQGELLSVTDALNNKIQFQYDGAGELVRTIDPLGRTASVTRDAVARMVGVTNPLGQTKAFEYDAMNHIKKVIDPAGGQSTFSYDADGNLSSMTDALGHSTTLAYDNAGLIESRTDPLGNTETYSYDGNGNLIQYTDRRGAVTTYQYDPLNRRTHVSYGAQPGAPGSTVNFSFDAGGRLVQAVDSLTGTISSKFDGLDRPISETTPQGTVTYSYDLAGRRTAMTVAGQAPINYAFDLANQLKQITQGTASVSFAYDAGGRRSSLTLPNGVIVNYSYDPASELTGISYQLNGASLGNLSYTYDAIGRRTTAGGPLADIKLPSAFTGAAYGQANQLTQRNNTTFTYDQNGNLLSDGTNAYTWDAKNRLIAINGVVSAGFRYDPLGRRVSKTVNGVTTNFVYDGANVVQELQAQSPSASLLSMGVDELFSRTDSTGTHSFITDALGSTIALANSSGALDTQYSYEPFGATTSVGQPNSNTNKFAGREDDGTGLYFNRLRYYSPDMQRFISQDPLLFRGGDLNLYSYAGNDPVNFLDPMGMDKKKPFRDCVKDYANVLSIKNILGLPDNPITDAVLGNAFADAIEAGEQLADSNPSGVLKIGAEKVADEAIEDGLKHANIVASATVTTVEQTTATSLTLTSSSVTLTRETTTVITSTTYSTSTRALAEGLGKLMEFKDIFDLGVALGAAVDCAFQ